MHVTLEKCFLRFALGLLVLSAGFLQSLPAFAAELLVTDRASNRLLAFDDSTGEFLRVVTDTGLDSPSGITLGPGGLIYVSNSAGGPLEGMAPSVVSVDPVTGETLPFTSQVFGPGGVGYHEASNTLFVSEFGNFDGDEVFRFDSGGSLMQTLGTGGVPTGRAGIAFDSEGNLYVSESNFSGFTPGSVLKYDAPVGDPTDPFGTSSATFASGADVTLQIPAPAGGFNGLAFDATGNLFVASLLGQAIIKFNVTEGAVTSGAPFGAPLPYPAGVGFAANGDVLATSLGNNNPMDPFYGGNLFPGSVNVFNQFYTGASPLLKGDVDRDGTVAEGDLAGWQQSYGAGFDGDLDGDFDTDGNDFFLWQQNLGHVGLSGDFQPTAVLRYEPLVVGEARAIPEPSSLALGLLLSGSLLVVRRG